MISRHRNRSRLPLELVEIDAQAFADVCHSWVGRISLIVDRIRPVLALLGIPVNGLEAAADIERLTKWLTSQSPLAGAGCALGGAAQP